MFDIERRYFKVGSTAIFFISLGGIVIFAYAVSYLFNINRYIVQRNYIKAEMNRSRSEREYKYWKRELKRLYLHSLPLIGRFF